MTWFLPGICCCFSQPTYLGDMKILQWSEILHRRSRLCISIDLWSDCVVNRQDKNFNKLHYHHLLSQSTFLETQSNRDSFSQTQSSTKSYHPSTCLSFHHQPLSNATAMTVTTMTRAAEAITKGLSRPKLPSLAKWSQSKSLSTTQWRCRWLPTFWWLFRPAGKTTNSSGIGIRIPPRLHYQHLHNRSQPMLLFVTWLWYFRFGVGFWFEAWWMCPPCVLILQRG